MAWPGWEKSSIWLLNSIPVDLRAGSWWLWCGGLVLARLGREKPSTYVSNMIAVGLTGQATGLGFLGCDDVIFATTLGWLCAVVRGDTQHRAPRAAP